MSKVVLHYSADYEEAVNPDVESVLADPTADEDEKVRTIFYSYQAGVSKPAHQTIEAYVLDDSGEVTFHGIVHDKPN